jgi:hypothetical protein
MKGHGGIDPYAGNGWSSLYCHDCEQTCSPASPCDHCEPEVCTSKGRVIYRGPERVQGTGGWEREP